MTYADGDFYDGQWTKDSKTGEAKVRITDWY